MQSSNSSLAVNQPKQSTSSIMLKIKRFKIVFTCLFLISSTSFANQQSIEFDQLIKYFLIEEKSLGTVIGWDAGSDQNSPIKWSHDGIKDAPKNSNNFSFSRKGEVVITVNNKPTHTVLKRKVTPGTWTIQMFGPRAGPMNIDISMNSVTQEGLPDLLGVLKKKGAKLNLEQCPDEPLMDGNTLYSMNLKGFKKAYLVHGWSCGASNCSQDVKIIHSASTPKIQCMKF